MPNTKLKLKERRELGIRGEAGQKAFFLASFFKVSVQYARRVIIAYKRDNSAFDPCHCCGIGFRKEGANDFYCCLECEIKDGEDVHRAMFTNDIPAIKKFITHRLKVEKAAILKSIEG